MPVARALARPYAYGTSNPLTELDLELAGGERLRLLLKDLSSARGPKPTFLHDPAREVETYRRILAPAGLGPRFYGAVGALLLLEKVDGVELWQLEHEAWLRAARWAAAAHDHLAEQAGAGHLLRLDAEYYALWPTRAQVGPAIARAYAQAVRRLLALPPTVIHNELYPSNVLVAGDRIVPVDWELAAAGPAVIDLAALTAGWEEEKAAAIVAAYGAADEHDVAAARLHLAVRWLGWAEHWRPPPEHARDWLAEAAAAASQLRQSGGS